MIDAPRVKSLIRAFGADLCGVAPVERFAGAPPGFRPTDVYGRCRSVVVFARKVPAESLFASSCIPYTHVNALVTQEVDALTLAAVRTLEELGIGVVPIPSDDPYEHWEPERSYGRGILSLRHAGHLAGLGVLGRNTLLINERFGNMIQIGAVLLDHELEGDPLATYEACPPACTLCLDSCPQGALDGETVDQALCRPLSNFRSQKGYVLKKCWACRRVCPSVLGLD
jgi:epoxyqueuosine reductase QueG